MPTGVILSLFKGYPLILQQQLKYRKHTEADQSLI